VPCEKVQGVSDRQLRIYNYFPVCTECGRKSEVNIAGVV
jgi:hypothetical protein